MGFVSTGKSERRRDKRLNKYVITLELQGQFYSTRDWSIGGFLIDGYQGSLQPGNVVPVNIVLESCAQTFEQQTDVMVARIDNLDQKLAARFSDLSDEAFDLLDGWQTGRLQRQANKKTA